MIASQKANKIYLDVWVSCKNNKKFSYLLKCNADGSFEINGKSGDEITLPDCSPIGCDPDDLGPFGSEECGQKGYSEVAGKRLENDRNKCFRKCGDVKSKRKVMCACDYANRTCEYKVFGSKELGYLPWQSKKPDGSFYVPLSDCSNEPDPTQPEPTQPEPTEPEPTEPAAPWGDFDPGLFCIFPSFGKGWFSALSVNSFQDFVCFV